MIANSRQIHRDYLQSDTWKRIREGAKWLAGYRCQLCGDDSSLETHHNDYSRFGGDERPEDLLVLCGLCHATFEWLKKNRESLRQEITEMFNRIEAGHVRLVEVGEYFHREVSALDELLSQVEERLNSIAEIASHVGNDNHPDVVRVCCTAEVGDNPPTVRHRDIDLKLQIDARKRLESFARLAISDWLVRG